MSVFQMLRFLYNGLLSLGLMANIDQCKDELNLSGLVKYLDDDEFQMDDECDLARSGEIIAFDPRFIADNTGTNDYIDYPGNVVDIKGDNIRPYCMSHLKGPDIYDDIEDYIDCNELDDIEDYIDYNELDDDHDSTEWDGVKRPKSVTMPDPERPDDVEQGVKFWEFSGEDWDYSDFHIDFSPDDVFQDVLIASYDYKHKIQSVELRENGSAKFNKLLSLSSFKDKYPFIPLAQSRGPYISSVNKANGGHVFISFDYYCAHLNSCGCSTKIKVKLYINERNDNYGRPECMLRASVCFTGYPCRHLPFQTAGIVRSVCTDKLKDYACNAFKDSLDNDDNKEMMHYGNFNHQIKSINQARNIKYKQNKLGSSRPYIDELDRFINKLMITAIKYKNVDLNELKEKHELDWDKLGMIHDVNALIPAFNIYHRSIFRALHKMVDVVVKMDDYSLHTKSVNGRNPNSTVITIPNPNENVAICIGEIMSFNWSADVWRFQFRSFWNALTDYNRLPDPVRVFCVDFYIGFISNILQVTSNITMKQYHLMTMRHCKNQQNKLPSKLIRVCNAHCIKNLCLRYKKSPNIKHFVRSVYEYCRDATDFNDWEYAISLGFYLDYNGFINASNDVWDKYDYSDKLDFNENEIDGALGSVFDRRPNKADYDNSVMREDIEKTDYNERNDMFSTDSCQTVYPFKNNTSFFYVIDHKSSIIIIPEIKCALPIIIETTDGIVRFRIVFTEYGFWEKYVWKYYVQFVGFYSRIIFNSFIDKIVRSNQSTEKYIQTRRQFVLQWISKLCKPTIDKYLIAVIEAMQKDFRILSILVKLRESKDIKDDAKAMAICAKYKCKASKVSREEREISFLFIGLVSLIQSYNVKLETMNLVKCVETFCSVKNKTPVFGRCARVDSKKRKINGILKNTGFAKSKKIQDSIKSFCVFGKKFVRSRETADSFIFKTAEVLKDTKN